MLNYCGMQYVKIDEIILIAYVVVIVHAFMVGFEIEAWLWSLIGNRSGELYVHVGGLDLVRIGGVAWILDNESESGESLGSHWYHMHWVTWLAFESHLVICDNCVYAICDNWCMCNMW